MTTRISAREQASSVDTPGDSRRNSSSSLQIDIEAPPLTRRTSQSTRPGPRRLTPIDERQAGYLLARDMVGRPVHPTVLGMITRCSQSVRETHEIMTLGRGNVKADIDASQGESHHLTIGTRIAFEDVKKSTRRDLPPATKAGIAAHNGAGHCAEYAGVVQHLHAPRLQEGEEITVLEHTIHDHGWAVLTGASGRAAVKLDPWAQCPVIEACDDKLMKRPEMVETHKVTQQQARAAHDEFVGAMTGPDAAMQRLIEKGVQTSKMKSATPPSSMIQEPQLLVRKSFAKSVRKAFDTVVTPTGEKLPPPPTGWKKQLASLKATVLPSARAAQRRANELREAHRGFTAEQHKALAVKTAMQMGASKEAAEESAERVVDHARKLRRHKSSWTG